MLNPKPPAPRLRVVDLDEWQATIRGGGDLAMRTLDALPDPRKVVERVVNAHPYQVYQRDLLLARITAALTEGGTQ